MLNRRVPPITNPITDITFPEIEKSTLANGIPMHLINDDAQEVVRVDFMFSGGVWHQPKALVSYLTNQMLKEGTVNLSSQEIAEKLDFYGSWLQLSASYHHSYLTVYCLSKYVSETLSIVEEMLKFPSFPETEYEVLLNKRKQQYLLDQEKVQSLSTRKFAACIYGAEHPYGKTAVKEDFDLIQLADLRKFYESNYRMSNMKIIVSGNIEDAVISVLENKFGKEAIGEEQEASGFQFNLQPEEIKQHYIHKEDAVQSAVRIGRVGIQRNHPDYPYMKVVTTILGGYFGSRLMSNVREEKGYTYGIGASLSASKEGGAFSIGTETATEYVQDLIKEVYKEMALMCQQPVADDELAMVKNVMLGDAVRMFDGTFSVADACISLLANDIDMSFYKNQIEAIRTITPQQIQLLARKYFVKDAFYEIVAGNI